MFKTMMNIWSKIDNYFIDCIFNPISHKLELLTNRNCFWFSYMCINIAYLLCIIESIIKLNYFLICVNIIVATFVNYAYRRILSNVEAIVTNKFINPLRIKNLNLRLLFIIFIITFGIQDISKFIYENESLDFISNIGFVFIIIGEYFAACDLLPPCEMKATSKLKLITTLT